VTPHRAKQRSHPNRNEVCWKVSAVAHIRKKAKVGTSPYLGVSGARASLIAEKAIRPGFLSGRNLLPGKFIGRAIEFNLSRLRAHLPIFGSIRSGMSALPPKSGHVRCKSLKVIESKFPHHVDMPPRVSFGTRSWRLLLLRAVVLTEFCGSLHPLSEGGLWARERSYSTA
jgi:hypothetical protein